MKEEKFEYPKVEFIRKKVKHEGVEVMEMSMFSIVTDQHLGEPLEIEFYGYYPFKGELSVHAEFAFGQMFHKICAIAYLTGMIPDDEIIEKEFPDEFTGDINDIDINDDGRLE